MNTIKLSSHRRFIATGLVLLLVVGVLLTACSDKSDATIPQGAAETALEMPADAENALLADLHGMVEVKTADGQWTAAQSGQTLHSGDHIRTGSLSNATVTFSDNGRIYLGTDAEITLNVLAADDSGARTVQLTQVSGESRHELGQSGNPESRYDVNTPAGSGSADGGKFTVMALPNQLSQFWVDEGIVFVVNANSTVPVAAGQTTLSLVGQPPTEPAFRVSGEGQLLSIETAGNAAVPVNQIRTTSESKRLNVPPAQANQDDKISLCHATGSATNPYVIITIAAEGATNGHAKHEGDIIPVPAEGCPPGTPLVIPQNTPFAPENENGKISLCHATGSATNPYVIITIAAEGAANGHIQHEGDIIPVPAEGCPPALPPTPLTIWNIAGQLFHTTANTVIIGNPQVGDWVGFEGYQLADGTLFADRIWLVSHTFENQFQFIGQVEVIDATTWTVSGRPVQVNEFTLLGTGIVVGDDVHVTGNIATDGIFWATSITQMAVTDAPFWFVGILTDISDDVWTISGIAVTVDENTLFNGEFVVGHPLSVIGMIEEDGTWLATAIDLATTNGYQFDFIGTVESMNPWVVSNVGFDTADWTEIDADIEVGNSVRVTGIINTDGIWLAEQIERLDTDQLTRFNFFGPVIGINPWNVAGISLIVDERTTIKGEITLGEMVKATGWILADGSWLATEIKHTGLHLGQGCFLFSSVVQSINSEQIVLIDGRLILLSDDLELVGDIREGSLVRYQYCVDEAGFGQIWRIIVVYQDQYQYRWQDTDSNGDKVILCHGTNNPHTIEIAQSAVSAHLAHGDTLGACPNNQPGNDKKNGNNGNNGRKP